jgi:hypothetical protein
MAKRKIDPLVIESQETVAEVFPRSTQMVRLSRVKYEGNDYVFIDMRVFSRGYKDDQEVYYPTRQGIQLKESDFGTLAEAFAGIAGRELKAREVH